MGIIENMLTTSFGEPSSKLKITYKKTVKVREYETEVIEATNELNVEGDMTGAERVLVSAILKSQMEFTVYTDLLIRGAVTQQEYNEKKAEIEETLYKLKMKCNSLGVNTDKYLQL